MNLTDLSTGTPLAGILRRHRLILAVASVSIAFFSIWTFRSTSEIDWNPFIRTTDELVGHWRGKESELTLDSLGKYTCTGVLCGNLASSGSWHRAGDFYMTFTPDGAKPAEFRLMARNGRITLVAGAPSGEDPDMWNPKFTFTRDSK